jgi:hypothetical protein
MREVRRASKKCSAPPDNGQHTHSAKHIVEWSIVLAIVAWHSEGDGRGGLERVSAGEYGEQGGFRQRLGKTSQSKQWWLQSKERQRREGGGKDVREGTEQCCTSVGQKRAAGALTAASAPGWLHLCPQSRCGPPALQW